MNLTSSKNLTFSAKAAYLAGGFAVFTALAVAFLLMPSVRQIKDLRAEIVTMKIEMENKMNRQQNMSEVATKLKLIEPQLPLLARPYINPNRELDFITMLEGIAIERNLQQTMNLDPANAKAAGNHRVVPLNLTLKGRYSDILRYLVALETGQYYINISGLNLSTTRSAARGEPDTANTALADTAYTATVNASTYWK